MFSFFKSKNKEDDVGAEALSETTKLLYKNIAIQNNTLDTFSKKTEADKTIFITIYFIVWAVKYCNYEKRNKTDFYLAENEIAPTIYLMDRIFMNLIYRCNDKSLSEPEVYDNLIKDFYRNYIIELYDLSLFKIKVKDALKVIKKTEEVAIKHLNEQDMVINNLINEAIDIFVLKDKEKSEAGLKNFYFLWNSLVDNFDTLLKET